MIGRPPLTFEQQQLVLRWRPLAMKLANRYTHFGRYAHLKDDGESIALWALCKAAQAFEPNMGFTFCTFAWAVIKRELLRHLRKMKNITNSNEQQKIDGRWQHAPRHDVISSVDVYSERLGMRSEEDLAEAFAAKQMWARATEIFVSSIPGFQRGKRGRGSTNPTRDADLFIRTQFGGESMTALGEEFGITKERVSQIVQRTRPFFERWTEEVRAEAGEAA